MTVTNFAADNSEIRVPIPASGGANPTGAMTIAAIAKRNSAAATAHTYLAGEDSTGGYIWEFFAATSANNVIWTLASGDGGQSATTATKMTTGTWHIIAWTKAAGTVQGRVHMYTFGGSWAHEAAAALGSTPTNPATIASGHVSFGEAIDVDDLDGRIALAGTWAAVLTDLQIEALTTNLRTSDWYNHAVSPTGLWQFNRAVNTDDLVDLTANAQTATGTITSTTDHSGIQGTTIVSGDDPAGWSFDGVGAVAVPALTMATMR